MELTQAQEQIIKEYKKYRLNHPGKAPKSDEFYKIVPKTKCQEAFPKDTYSSIQAAGGDEPQKFKKPGRTRDEFFEIYGNIVKGKKNVPSGLVWNSLRVEQKNLPARNSYTRILNIKWSQLPLAFIDWANDKPEWEDVVNICTIHCKNNKLFSENAKGSTTGYGYVYLIKANRKGQYKIGKTGSTGGRASQLSQLDPHVRRYEHVLETTDPSGLEKYWHRRFKDKEVNIDKEIFELSQQDIKAFKEFYVKEAPKTY